MKVYSFQNSDDELLKASSGGAFYAIASSFDSISSSPAFFGAAYDGELNVIHTYVTSLEQARIFQGSKYVKSDIKEIYNSVKGFLLEGKSVLFSGTPCQIFGLQKYLENNSIPTDSLLTVDIICHGVPQKNIYRDYLEWIHKRHNSKPVKISFRDKRGKWEDYCISVELENGKKLFNTYELRTYMRLFFSSVIISKGCFKCPYSNLNRVSDITIGDFWGIDEVVFEYKKKRGVSLVLVNTEKGQRVFDLLPKGEYKIFEVMNDKYLKFQHNLKSPTGYPNNYVDFNEDYKKLGFERTIKKYNYYSFYGFFRSIGRRVLDRIRDCVF